MNTSPRISLIIPTYNVQNFIFACLSSIESQTYTNFEVLIVDSSTDETPKIIEKVCLSDSRFSLFRQPKCGVSRARNFGISMAKGDLLAFPDGDDFLDPRFLEVLVSSFADNPDILFAKCSDVIVSEDGINVVQIEKERPGIKQASVYLSSLLTYQSSCAAWGTLFKKEIFTRSLFPENINNEDFIFWFLSLRPDDTFFQSDDLLYRYRFRNGSLCRSGFSRIFADAVVNSDKAYQIVQQKWPDLLPAATSFCIRQRYNYLSRIPLKLMNKNNAFYQETKIYLFVRKNQISEDRFLPRKMKKKIRFLLRFPFVFKVLSQIKRRFNG